MTRVATARLTTGLLAAALAAGTAGVLAAPAGADDGAPVGTQPPELVTGAPGVDAGDAIAAVEDELASAVEAADAALPDVDAPVDTVAASEPAADAEQPAADDDQIADVPNAAEAEETSENTADTAADTTPAVTAPSSGTTQSSPTNVNVSVRIGSAGDNGPVTQVNMAAALTSSAVSAPTTTIANPSSAVAQTTAQPVVSPGGSSAISPTAATSQESGAWTWQWDCMSAPSFDGLSPGGSGEGSIPSNWTWIWNCGGNTDQYQSATAGQYQPINMNVSIRIASPGNDGDVKQSNVAVAVSVGSAFGASAAVQSSADSSPVPDSPVSGIALPALPALPALVLVAPAVVLSPGSSVVPEAGDGLAAVDGALDLLVPWLRPSEALAPVVGVGAAIGAGTPRLGAPTIGPRGELVATRPALGPSGLPVPALRASPVETGPAASPAPAAKSAKRASHWQVPTHTGSTPKRAPSGTSVSAAGAAGASSGGLPIFLALPFLAALLDLARRVALERFATPSGHRSRIPDTPG